jgi:hypothetical protein
MVADGGNVVAGLFRSQRQADAALQALHRVGLTDADIEVGVPEPGRYRVEYYESQEVGGGILRGIALGILIGGILGAAFLVLSVPRMALVGSISLGFLIGAFWGIFFGGLVGMMMRSLAPSEALHCTIAAGSHQVVVIAHAGDQSGLVQALMKHDGARYFFRDVPELRSSQRPLVATS